LGVQHNAARKKLSEVDEIPGIQIPDLAWGNGFASPRLCKLRAVDL
jgi:hypothetical protein